MSIYDDTYAAMLPRRAAATAAELSERLAGVLPDGTRFTWSAQPLTPRELWAQAYGDPARYGQLMAQHGYEPEPDVPDTWPRR